MCGIFAVLSASQNPVQPSSTLRTRLVNRGPDHLGQYDLPADSSRDWSLGFTSTVLALRGSALVEQPLVNEAGEHVLCWNGEAWRIGGRAVSRNDGAEVLEGLTTKDDAGEFLRSIQGPFAFVFFSKSRNRLYFGRDRLGRRSLLMRHTADSFKLSSVAEESGEGWQEVEADGFYSIDVLSTFEKTMSTLARHPWVHDENSVGRSSEPLALSAWPTTYVSRYPALAPSTTPSPHLRADCNSHRRLSSSSIGICSLHYAHELSRYLCHQPLPKRELDWRFCSPADWTVPYLHDSWTISCRKDSLSTS